MPYLIILFAGLESICFAYRPLSTDEINYLKTNFTKNIYILTINKRKVYNIKNFYNEPNFPCKENERFLSHLISTSIFIGNKIFLFIMLKIYVRACNFFQSI